MAMATPVAGGRGKRSLDAEIILVPFIDLLSMCICFLLITAVWIQIAVVQVKQGRGTEAETTTAPYDLEVRFVSPTQVEAELKKGGKTAKKMLWQGADAAAAVSSLDKGLESWLRGLIGNALPATEPLSKVVGSAMVTPKAGVNYGDLVLAMDALRKHQLINLGVTPGEGK